VPEAGCYYVHYHGGNNVGPRQIGLAMTTDLTSAAAYTKWASNPIIANGAGGTQYDKYIADFAAKRLGLNNWVAFTRGVSNADNRLRIHRFTSTDGITWTWRGVALDIGTSTAWDDESVSSPWWFRDVNNRTHLYYAGEGTTAGSASAGIGYAYTDDDITQSSAITFTRGSSNPIASSTGTNTDYDFANVGDTIAGIADGDAVLLNCEGFNTTAGIPTINGTQRFDGRVQFYEALANDAPTRGGKFYRTPRGVAAANKQYSSFSNTILPLNATSYTLLICFRLLKSNVYGHFITFEAAFNKQVFLRVDNTGFLHGYNRTPTAIAEVTSATRYDDGTPRWAMWRRTAASAFDLYVGDASSATLIGSASTSPGTDATATFNAIGNWHASAPVDGTLDQPAHGALWDAAIVIGGTISTADAQAWFNNRTVPTPSGGTMYRWKIGGSNTTTDTEEGGSGLNLTHTGTPLPVRVEVTPQAAPDLSATTSPLVGRSALVGPSFVIGPKP
jgi:hypothetical protein